MVENFFCLIHSQHPTKTNFEAFLTLISKPANSAISKRPHSRYLAQSLHIVMID
jgi:hypothetical protein